MSRKPRSSGKTALSRRPLVLLGGAAFVVIALAAAAILILNRPAPVEAGLTPVDSVSHEFPNNHLHGLGYDAERERLFIATHYGLFILDADEALYQVGDSRDDFMGFSMHPHDARIMYASGHPRTGGNLGVIRSQDGGRTWEQIFRGLDDEIVDFHSMTVSAADPDRIYGFFYGPLYRSLDGGDNWEIAALDGLQDQGGFCFGVPCLAADTEDADTIYAGAPTGLFRSRDNGDTWELVADGTGAVAGLAVDPQDNQRLVAFTQRYGVAISHDGGQTWGPRNDGIELEGRDLVFEFAFHPRDSQIVFAATTAGQIYRSDDGGATWQRILSNHEGH